MKKKFTLLIAMLLSSLGFTTSAADGDVITFTDGNWSGTMYARVISENDKTAEWIANPNGSSYSPSGNSLWRVPSSAGNYTIISMGEFVWKNLTIQGNLIYRVSARATLQIIKENAFSGTTIGYFRGYSGINTIYPGAFKNNNVKYLDFHDNGGSVYSDINYVLTNAAKTTLIAFPNRWSSSSPNLSSSGNPNTDQYKPIATSYTVPSSITTIGAYAFYGNSHLATLDLGSVTTVEDSACVNMSALRTLTIPATVTSISADAFAGTTGITSLTVNCEWNDNLANVVFDDAVYERLLDQVTWNCSDDSKAAFKANINWGRFFTGGGAPLETYNITYGSMTNGTVTGPTSADNGTTVTLTVTPDINYDLESISVLDANNAPVPLSNSGYSYSFIMPASNVTVNATFVYIPNIYIMGQVNGNSWAGNVGASMTYDPATHNYTATVTTMGEADGYSYFSFSRALGNDANNWPADDDRFGAVLDATHTVNVSGNDNFNIGSADLNTPLTMSNYGSTVAYRLPQGTWTITIANLLDGNTATTMTVTGTWPNSVVNVGNEAMTYNSDNQTYTYTLTVATEDLDNDGLYRFSLGTRLVSGSMPFNALGTGVGERLTAQSDLGNAIALAAGSSTQFAVPVGTWTLTVANIATTPTLTIAGTWPETKVYMNYDGHTYEMTEVSGGAYTYNLVNAADLYFNVARKLESGNYPLTYFGTSGNHNVLRTEIGTPITVAADGTQDFFKLPAGDWTITLSAADGERTMTITGEWPSNGNVYLLGTNQGWNPSDGSMQFIYDGNAQTYTLEFTAQESENAGEEGYSFFSFTTALGTWDEIASSRRGADSDQKLIEFAEGVNSISATVQGGTNSFKIVAGEEYTLTLNYEMTQLTVETYDKLPFQDGKFYYQAINPNEVEIIANPNGNKYSTASNVITASDFKATATNSREDKSYTVVGFGEASMAGEYFVGHNASNTLCKIDEVLSNYRYIKSRAFDGVNAASIMFYHITEIAPDAFINNKAHGISAFVSGYFTNIYKSFSYPSEQISTIPVLGTEDGLKVIAYPGAARKNSQISSESGRTRTIDGIGESIQEIGAYAFYGNQYITTLDFGSSSVVTIIGDHTFENSKLVTLNLPATLTTIGEDAFKGVTTLQTISISAATPPTMTSEFDDAVYNNCTLTLSGEAATAANKLAYMVHPIWGKFFKGTTLANTLSTATNGEPYKVSDNLKVAFADTDENVLYLADNNGGTAQQAPEEDWIDYMERCYPGGMAYNQYAHNNWAAIHVEDASLYHANDLISTVVGTLNTNTRTFTTAVNPQIATEGESFDLDINTYIVAAFGGRSQTSAITGETYYFVQPTPNELATVAWAQYAGEGRFIVPTSGNGAGLTGELLVDTNSMTGEPIVGNIYTLDGLLVPYVPTTPETPTAGAPRRAEGDTSWMMKGATLSGGHSPLTGIDDMQVYGNVESVTYYDVAGHRSNRPFNGLNIVVTRYSNGKVSTSKVVK